MIDDIVTIKVGDREFRGWEGISISCGLGQVARAISVSCEFNPQNRELIESIRPFTYPSLSVYVKEDIVLNGYLEKVSLALAASERNMNIEGRGRAGILLDASADELAGEYEKITIRQFSERLCSPYNIKIDAPDIPIDRTTVEPAQSVADALLTVSGGMRCLISDEPDGTVRIFRFSVDKIVASLIEGQSPIKSISAGYDGTKRYRQYKVIGQTEGQPTVYDKAEDPYCANDKRIKVLSYSEGDVSLAAKWQRALALSSAVNISLSVSGWWAPNNKLWSPGMCVSISSPSILISDSLWVIESVTLKYSANEGYTTDIGLSMPARFTGELPEEFPWSS